MSTKKELQDQLSKLYKNLKTTIDQTDKLLLENKINNIRKQLLSMPDDEVVVETKTEIIHPEPHIEISKDEISITDESIEENSNDKLEKDEIEEDTRGKVTINDNNFNTKNYNKHNRKNK